MGAVLSQDIEAFDTDLTTGKIITGVTSHMNVIQDAIGEKVSTNLQYTSIAFQHR